MGEEGKEKKGSSLRKTVKSLCRGGPGQCGAAGSRRRLSRMIHCLHTAPTRQPAPGGVAWRSRQNIFWLISPTRKKNIITFISGSSFSQRWRLGRHLYAHPAQSSRLWNSWVRRLKLCQNEKPLWPLSCPILITTCRAWNIKWSQILNR